MKRITEKQRDVYDRGLTNASKTAKRISRDSYTSLSYTYRCLNDLEKRGYIKGTKGRPKEFTKMKKLPESDMMTKEQSGIIRSLIITKQGSIELCEKSPYRWSKRKSMTKKMARELIEKLKNLPDSKGRGLY